MSARVERRVPSPSLFPRSLTERQPQVKVSDTDSEATPLEFVRLMSEVSCIQSSERRQKLISHELRSALKEYLGLPFHSYSMAVGVNQEGVLDFFDDIYLLSSVRVRCRRAVEIITDQVKRRRYRKEEAQTVSLIDQVSRLFHVALEKKLLPQAVLDCLLCITQETVNMQEEPHEFALDWPVVQGFISPDVAWQFDLKDPAALTTSLGPKIFYLLPQSEVHAGWKTALMIAQPVYVHETKQWLLLQDQHFLSMEWPEYHALFASLKLEYPDNISFLHRDAEESFLMAQSVVLNDMYRTMPASEAFIQLVHGGDAKVLAKQQSVLAAFRAIEQTIPLHAQYLIEAMELISQKFTPDSQEWNEWMYQSIVNSVATLFNQAPFSHQQKTELLSELHGLLISPMGDHPWQVRALHQQRAALVSPAISLGLYSKLECTVFSIPSLLKVHNPALLQAIQNGSISRVQLAQVIGAERAKLWSKGECRVCHAANVLVGECAVCLHCEQQFSHQGVGSKSKNTAQALGMRNEDLPAISLLPALRLVPETVAEIQSLWQIGPKRLAA